MELTSEILSPTFLTVGSILFAAGLSFTLWRTPWYWLRREGVATRLVVCCIAVSMIWLLRAELANGPAVHLLGATLLTLAFGWQLAILALSVVLVATTIVTTNDWLALGTNGVLLALLPVAVSYVIARIVEALLPRHLFVYLFCSSFFGAALAVAAVSFSALALAGWAGIMDPDALSANYRPTALLLLFPEAFITGALVTLAAIYRADWLVSFDERRYLSEAGDSGA